MQPKLRTMDAATGRWPGILTALGMDSRFLRTKHGPCPMCGGKDRWRFDDKEGRGTWYCSHCGAGSGMDLLMGLHGWDFKQAAVQVDRVIGTVPEGPIRRERSEESKAQALRRVWKESQPVTCDDPVLRYLHRRVGIDVVPGELRCHPALRYTDDDGKELGRFSAMLALLRGPDGEGVSLHRTYLTEDGQKAPVPEPKKMMPGKELKSAAVRLSAVERCLGIAEGIKTALAASMRFRVPVWSATSAGLLEVWVPPEGVAEVLIFADNDASYTGQAAAYVLAKRLVRNGLAVEVKTPNTQGKDWAA